MRNQWERDESYNFPSDKPVWSYAAFLLAFTVLIGSLWMEFSGLTPLQRYWIPTYLHANLLPLFKVGSSRYRLVWITHRDSKTYFPSEDEVQAGTTIMPDGYRIPLELSVKATLDGKQFVRTRSGEYDNRQLTTILNRSVYQISGISDFFSYPLTVAALSLIGGLIFAVPADRRRALVRKHGRRIQGPEEVTAAEFNSRNRSDGVGFTTLEKPTIGERVLRREWQYVRIPQAVEDNHFLIMGDSGSGKSSLVRQLLLDIHARGESAIVYDPALEYTGEFYQPQRGDVILNPLDQRMPYWVPSAEIMRPAEALTVAGALFPDTPKENPFFVEGPRKIFAYLLSLGLTTDELIWCLCHEEELDRKLKGSELASLVYANAGQQRGGILASLSMVADSLKLLPTKADATTTWTAAEWSQKRQGWIFITSLPATRKQLRPLISMWLDVLILRLMNEGRRGTRPTWFVLDELSSLHHLPQLHTAITENRKSGNPLVLSFQGRSQLEALYGHVAEAMFSQPATKIFLRTSEPNSAQWISNLIGNVELERVRETRTRGQMPQGRESRSYSVEQIVKPLVMKEQISGLPKGCGFLKFGNLVVRLSFPYEDLPKRHPDFLERPIQNQRARLECQSAQAGSLGFGNAAATAKTNGQTKRESTGAPPSNDLKPDSSQSQYLK